MSGVFVHGLGAVSPAGWGVPPLREAVAQGKPLAPQPLARPGWDAPLQVRAVPPPVNKPAYLAHARLRRASPMTHYAVGAALEALGSDADLVKAGALRLGIITGTMTGGISYSRRFYQEVLQDPAMASPLVFPETVFNAPASHLSAYLGTSLVNYSFVGDASAFAQGLVAAAQWLADGVAEACLVIGAEELDWTSGDALRLFQPRAVLAAGAGALYLKNSPEAAVELAAVTDLFPATSRNACGKGRRKIRAQLPADGEDSPDHKRILGEGFVASAAWQCVLACDGIQHCQYTAANVMITGAGQQSIGARFVKTRRPV